MPEQIECGRCHGSGADANEAGTPCWACEGSGRVDPSPPGKAHFWCEICRERVEHDDLGGVMGAIELAMDHFRVYHPDTYADMRRWPDGAPIIVDQTLEPGDFET